MIVFSTTDRASFDAVPAWRRRLTAECGEIALALVQSKVDLLDRAAVSSEEAEEMARRLGIKFYRSCAKEGLNVTEGARAPQPAREALHSLQTSQCCWRGFRSCSKPACVQQQTAPSPPDRPKPSVSVPGRAPRGQGRGWAPSCGARRAASRAGRGRRPGRRQGRWRRPRRRRRRRAVCCGGADGTQP